MPSPRTKTNTADVATEIRDLRTRSGLSQPQFAEIAACSVTTVKRWEAGKCEPSDLALSGLRSRLEPKVSVVREVPSFRFIDLFAGIGGLRLGFESISGQCVFTSEWDVHSQRTYRANFGDHHIAGDIVGIANDDIPEHDVLLAGFPCQPFSIAGVSKKNSLGRKHGFECETQGTLFFEVERILEAHRPKAFLLENVKNLKGHDGGRTFDVIMRTLGEKLGYHVRSKVLNARPFVPQHRERIFIVGFRDDVDFTWEDVTIPPQSEWPTLGDILHSKHREETPEERFVDTRGGALGKYVLTDHLWRYLQDYAAKHRAKGNGFGFGLVGPKDIARTLSARYYKDGSEILIKRGSGNPRRLTPRECARLMGFDRGVRQWTIPVSDTQAYRQFGNSVVVPLVEAVARAMRPHIVDERYRPARRQLSLELVAAD
ncbi:MAG: DNA (cytosine-5-)-methyltransferase [Gemmatimonadetes bacterium]|nr:DNA (cytosine-5-)-methyltransferase [Gemmatimonadota bacterium]